MIKRIMMKWFARWYVKDWFNDNLHILKPHLDYLKDK